MFGHRRWMVAWVAVGVLGLASGAWAERIILKDGQEIEGKIVSQTDRVVKVKVEKYGITVTRSLRRADIKSILKDAEAAARKAETATDDEQAPSPQPEPQAEKAEAVSTKPAASKDKADERPGSEGREPAPVEIDLRMALTQPLIRDTFESAREKIEPFGRGYFVLIPFRYRAGDKPYSIARQTIKFKADHGSARVRGFVPLEEKGGGAKRTRASAGSAEAAVGEQDEEISLEVGRNSPLYLKMTVYQDEGDLMVSFTELPKTESDRDKASGTSARRSSRSYGTARRSRGMQGRRSQRRGSGRTSRGMIGKRDSERESRDPEERGYRKRGYTKSKDEQEDTAESKAGDAGKTARVSRQPREGEPASGWAAALVELANEAAVVTAFAGPGVKIPIELRLIDALAQPTGRSRSRGSEDELDRVEAVADYAAHESPAMSRLAVRRLAELRGSEKSRGTGQGSDKQGEGTIDERTRLIESALLEAATSQDEQTRRIAWREITSTETLPDSTGALIAGLERNEVAEALFKLADSDIKNAAKTAVPTEVPEGGRRSGPRRPPSARGQKTGDTPSYTPVGLPESAAAQGVWNVLGALMRVGDDKSAMRAMSLALQDGTRQAITALGQPYLSVILRASKAIAEAPNAPMKHEALRMILSGLANNEEGRDVEAVSALSQVAKSMALAGDPPKVAGTDELLMTVVSAKRDVPKVQLAWLGLLEWCAMDQVMASPEMEPWLNGMTDNLVARECQVATYRLIAKKWRPTSLPPLTKHEKPQDASPADEKPTDPTAARRPPAPKADPRKAGRSPRAESQGIVEKFLLGGLKSRPEPDVRMAIIMALLRAGRDKVVLELLQSAEPTACVGLIKALQHMTGQDPPSLVPGTPSRFTSLGLVMGLAGKHNNNALYGAAIVVLDGLLQATGGEDLWRLGLAFKRRLQWRVLSGSCSASDRGVASRARAVIGSILGLAKGERAGLDAAGNRNAIEGKLKDYDQQRGGKIAGTYHGLILCDLLVPTYTLQFESKGDSASKERTAKVVDLNWHRQIVALEPGLFDVVVNKDREVEVKLGDAVVGTGKAPTPKTAQPAGRPGLTPGAKGMSPAAAMRLAQLRGRSGRAGGAPAAEPTGAPFAIQLPKLVAAMATLPSMRGKLPPMTLPAPTGQPKAKPRAGAKPTALFCPMDHLAFGTRQGSLQPGDGKPPTVDNPEVRVDAEGRIIRGAQLVPILQEIQIFLEPKRGEPTGG